MVCLSFLKEDNLTLQIFYHFNNLSETCSRSSAYTKRGQITSNRRVPFFDYVVWEIQERSRIWLSFIWLRKKKNKTIRSETSPRYFDEMQNFDAVYQDQANILFLLCSWGPWAVPLQNVRTLLPFWLMTPLSDYCLLTPHYKMLLLFQGI